MMWLVLAGASLFELAFTVFMKLSEGLRVMKYTLLTVVSVALSIGLLSFAVTKLPLGPAYAVWTGLGTVLNVGFGILVFGESRSTKKLLCVAAVILGIVGLRLAA